MATHAAGGSHAATAVRSTGKPSFSGWTKLAGALMFFDPRPNEHQRFKLPDSLLEK